MRKRLLKNIYKLRDNKIPNYEAYKIIQKKYNYDISRNEYIRICASYNIPYRSNKQVYTNRQAKLMLRMYEISYDLRKTLRYINERLNIEITFAALEQLAYRNNISKKRHSRIGRQKHDYSTQMLIISEYNNGATARNLSTKYGYKSHKSILDIMERHKKEARSPEVAAECSKTYKNFDLDKIDSSQKAYFIGLMLTDGYVSSTTYQLGIDLIDEDAISFLSEYTNRSYSEIKSKNPKHLNKYRLVFNSRKLKEQLVRFGVVPNKSLILEGPKLFKDEEIYLPYILRGIIDGDGWIRKDGKEFFICSCSLAFITWCKESLETFGMSQLNFILDSNNCYILRTARQENLRILKEKIYYNRFGMSRKHKRLKGRSETVIGTA